jgi:hypothetical protein
MYNKELIIIYKVVSGTTSVKNDLHEKIRLQEMWLALRSSLYLQSKRVIVGKN